MGNYSSVIYNSILSRGRKRKHEDESSYPQSGIDEEIEKRMHTPKRKKLMSTSRYIYRTLFEGGQNSDVTIIALGEEWRLHRVYLRQSPYFASMFSGAWKEVHEDEINIEIADSNITIEALQAVFGALYQDEVIIEPAQVIHVLGAAFMFQLDSLINQCLDIMKETINAHTVIKYFTCANQYALNQVSTECHNWLLRNLLSYLSEYPKNLRDISSELMEKLVSSPSLFVMQTEFSIYILLKTWVFLLENPTWEGSAPDCVVDAHKYFQKSEDKCFLTSEIGEKYLPVFKALRLQHLINHHMDVEMLENDRMIPVDWLLPIFRGQWYQMLRIDQGIDKGPKQMSEEEFNKVCLRCGRALTSDGPHVWRWTGYNFGLDLIVTYDKRTIKFKRNHRTDGDYQSTVSQQPRRHIMYKLSIASVDEQKQLTYFESTGLHTITLGKNEEIRVMSVDSAAAFPLLLSANFAVTTPLLPSSTAKPSGTSDNALNSGGSSEDTAELPMEIIEN